MQSVLNPAPGSGAALVHELGLVLYACAGLVFILVIGLALRAVFSGPKPVDTRRWIIGAGIAFPVTVLSGLLIYSLAVGHALSSPRPGGAVRFLLDCLGLGASPLASAANPARTMRIEVTGKRWWWEVRYRFASGPDVVLANELHLPTGRPVELFLQTSDVIHSFWTPALAGKVDMIPGRRNRIVLQTDQAGIYRGQCAEYCGGQHALMAFYVVSETEPHFQAWLAREAQPASLPADPFLRRGYEAFMRGRCGECHTVRGTAAAGTDGPDLTHIGSRRSLAAGVLRNHIGTLAGWIAGTQDIKRGSLMPSTDVYTGEELRAVSAWLESLE